MTRTLSGDFSKGKVFRIILQLGLPMMLAEFVHVLYNIVDRMYIGHMADGGTLALTGLGISFPLITLIGAFANLYSTGGATLATIARGAKEDRKAERIMGTSFTMLLLTGLALTVFLYLAAPVLLRLLGGDDETLSAAMGYFRIYVLGTVPVLISLGMNPFINAQGFPKIGMITVIIGAALNIGLDPLLIYTLNMGNPGSCAGHRSFSDGRRVVGSDFSAEQKSESPADNTAAGDDGTEGDYETGRHRFYFPGDKQRYPGNCQHHAQGLGRPAEYNLCRRHESDQFHP